MNNYAKTEVKTITQAVDDELVRLSRMIKEAKARGDSPIVPMAEWANVPPRMVESIIFAFTEITHAANISYEKLAVIAILTSKAMSEEATT